MHPGGGLRQGGGFVTDATSREAATDIQAFRGWVVDDLHTIETELGRSAAPDRGPAVE